MEGTFDSAKNQFKANYIQYFLTNENKYKSAYETAQKTMDSILEKAPETPEPTNTKTTHEHSYSRLRQTTQPQTIQSQTWKYWTLGALVTVSAGLMMF